MTNPENFYPGLLDQEFSKNASPAKQVFPSPEMRQPGPVRALPISEVDWARLDAIKPYPESPIQRLAEQVMGVLPSKTKLLPTKLSHPLWHVRFVAQCDVCIIARGYNATTDYLMVRNAKGKAARGFLSSC